MNNKKRRKNLCILILFFGISIIFRFGLACRFPVKLVCYPDELRYYRIAASLFNGTGISVYNAPENFQKILYSVLILPAFVFKSTEIRVNVIFFINAILMSFGIFPVYYLASKFLQRRKYRFLCCLAYLLFGFMTYTMTFVSENLWIPYGLLLLCIFYKLITKDYQQIKRNVLCFNLTAGIMSYLGYLTKEIALIFPISYLTYMGAMTIYNMTRNKTEEVKMSWEFWPMISYIVGFALPFVLLKVTLFYGMGNSYD